MRRAPPPIDDDELSELPPLDGEADEESEPDVELDDAGFDDDLDDTAGPERDRSLDEIDIDESEPSWLSEDMDSDDLLADEVLLSDLAVEDSLLVDSEEAEGPSAADLPGDSSERIELDGGEEGPLAPDDELRDEDLPALDADADGELDDAAFMSDHPASEEPVALPWAAIPWPRVGAPLDLVSATAVACVPRGALVAARAESGAPGLFRVDLEGSRDTLIVEEAGRAQLVSLTADGHRVAGVLSDGRLIVSGDGGGHFETAATSFAVVDALYVSGSLWLRTSSGALLTSTDSGRSFSRHLLPGVVAAMARDGASAIVALVVDEARRAHVVMRAAADGHAFDSESIDEPHAGAPTSLASRAGHVAYAGPHGGARRAPGGPWQSFAWEGQITAMTFVDDDGTLLGATYSATEDTTGLVCLDGQGHAAVVARLGASARPGESTEPIAPRGDGRALAVACDDACAVVWAVGSFGVAAFAIAPRAT